MKPTWASLSVSQQIVLAEVAEREKDDEQWPTTRRVSFCLGLDLDPGDGREMRLHQRAAGSRTERRGVSSWLHQLYHKGLLDRHWVRPYWEWGLTDLGREVLAQRPKEVPHV